MAIDGISWNLVFQIPIAGVIIVVVILFLRHLKEMTVAFMAAQAKQADDNKESQKEVLAIFMQAIKEQREANNTAMGKVAEGFTALSNSISDRLEEMAVVKATTAAVRSRK